MNLELLTFLQRFQNPVLDLLFQALTMMGEPVFLALVFCSIYWCRNKELGRYMIFSLSLSLCVNGLIKDLVRAPRPIGQPGIVTKHAGSTTGFSFPSAHAQTSASAYGAIAIYRRKPGQAALLCLLVLGVGVSRLYLGVHYPIDVLGGWLIGLLLSYLTYLMLRLPGTRMLLAVLCGVLAVWALVLGSSSDTVGGGGLALGTLAGLYFEERAVRFVPVRQFGRSTARLAGGFALVGASYLLPSLLLPEAIWVSTLKYALVAFLAVGGWPWFFTRLESGWIRKAV